MRRIAIVTRSMVRGGEANSLNQIHAQYSMRRIAITRPAAAYYVYKADSGGQIYTFPMTDNPDFNEL